MPHHQTQQIQELNGCHTLTTAKRDKTSFQQYFLGFLLGMFPLLFLEEKKWRIGMLSRVLEFFFSSTFKTKC